MRSKEEREAKAAFWLQHLCEWSASGGRLAEYAHRHELDVDEGYRWTRILRRAGRWPQPPKSDGAAPSAIVVKKLAPRFARVRIEPPQRAEFALPWRLQLLLTNGRRAELVLSDERQLPRVLGLLEQPG